MNDESWEDPEQPQAPDINRAMRRLAQAVVVQSIADFKSQDSRLRVAAEKFLYPNQERHADLKWTVDVSGLGLAWLNQRLTRLRAETPPLPAYRICKACSKPQPDGYFHRSGTGSIGSRCKRCLRDEAIQRKASQTTLQAAPYAVGGAVAVSAPSAAITAKAIAVADCSVTSF